MKKRMEIIRSGRDQGGNIISPETLQQMVEWAQDKVLPLTLGSQSDQVVGTASDLKIEGDTVSAEIEIADDAFLPHIDAYLKSLPGSNLPVGASFIEQIAG